jgi:anti-sigma B factor antagonist
MHELETPVDLVINEAQAPAGTAVVSFPVGNLDAGNVKDFRASIEAIAATHDALVLDMSRLTFVDSSGLGALLSCLRTMKGKKGQLLLFGMTKQVRALFELVRMHRIFSIYNSLEEALDELAAA